MHASWVVRYLLKEWEDKKNPLAHYAIDHTEAVREREREREGIQIYEMELKPKLSQNRLLFLFIFLHKKFIRIEKLNK